MIQNMRIDCSEAEFSRACSKLMLRTGYLMKILSKQQEPSVSRTDWDMDQRKTEDYISDNKEVQSEKKGQESSEVSKSIKHKTPIFPLFRICQLQQEEQGL
jgi:hypothetical protein